MAVRQYFGMARNEIPMEVQALRSFVLEVGRLVRRCVFSLDFFHARGLMVVCFRSLYSTCLPEKKRKISAKSWFQAVVRTSYAPRFGATD